MSSEWKEMTLGDVTQWNSGGTPKKDVAKYWNGDIPWISANSMHGTRFYDSELKITSDGLNNGSRLASKDSVLLLVRGGALHNRLPVGIAMRDVAFNQDVKSLVADPKILSSWYLLYWLVGNERYLLDSIVEETGIGAGKLDTKRMQSLTIRIPSISTQNQIVKVFKSIDDKIELNRQTNQTLEQIAQALFKSWFVDFEPTRAKIAAKEAGASLDEIERAALCAISGKTPAQLTQLPPETQQTLKTTVALFPDALVDSELGEVPEGWEVKAMGKYVEIKRGGSPRPIQDFMAETGFPWTKISDATAEASPFLFRTKEFIKEEGLKKTVLLKKGTLILSNSATPGLPKFLELDACIHDGWLYFPSKSHFSDIYLFHLFLMLKESFISQGNGSIFTNLKTDILRNQTIVIPPLKLLQAFESIANHIFGVVRSNCKEMIELTSIRDSLLPKLLSGEIPITESLTDLQGVV